MQSKKFKNMILHTIFASNILLERPFAYKFANLVSEHIGH